MSSCKFCHRDFVSATAYEDGIYGILGQWLKLVTCIDWYRYSSSGRRPEGQFGMIFLHSSTQTNKDQKVVEFSIDGSEESSNCLVVDQKEVLMMDLIVCKEDGEFVRCDQSTLRKQSTSSSDILKKVNVLCDIVEFTQLLVDNNIRIAEAEMIDTRVVERKKVPEYWSEATFKVTICRTTSYAIDGDQLTYCIQLCDGTPICQAKEYPDCNND